MLVFGYGSLMWDGWQSEYRCTRSEQATLTGYTRAFNKASTLNWGTRDNRGPTLGLEPSPQGECVGRAFELPDETREACLKALQKREGASFVLSEREVALASGATVSAIVPVNDMTKPTYIGRLSLSERSRMAKQASGTSGSCVEYVAKVHRQLQELAIEDAAVEAFWRAVGPE